MLALLLEEKGFQTSGQINLYDKKEGQMVGKRAMVATVERDKMQQFLDLLSSKFSSNFKISKGVFDQTKALLGIDIRVDYKDGAAIDESESGLSSIQIDINNPLYQKSVEAQDDSVTQEEVIEQEQKEIDITGVPTPPPLAPIEHTEMIAQVNLDRVHIALEYKLLKLYRLLLPALPPDFDPETYKRDSGAIKYRADVTGRGENRWSSSGKEYNSVEDAKKYLDDLSGRWFGYDMGRVVPVTTPKNEDVDTESQDIYQNFRKKLAKGGPAGEGKEYFYKDKSGRGFKGKFNEAHIRSTWTDEMEEQDWTTGDTLAEFLENSEPGDEWETATIKLTDISDEKKEKGGELSCPNCASKNISEDIGFSNNECMGCGHTWKPEKQSTGDGWHVTYMDDKGNPVDSAQLEAKNDEEAWRIFETMGYEKKPGYSLHWEEGLEYANGGPVKERTYATGGKINWGGGEDFGKDPRLASVTPNDLDDYEQFVYNDKLEKGASTHGEAIQLIINQVEGDYSQLSDKLAEIARAQDAEQFAQGGGLKKYGTEEKKIAFVKKKGNIVTFKEIFYPRGTANQGFRQILVTGFLKDRKDGAVKIEGRAYDSNWYNSMGELLAAVDWDWMERSHADGGSIGEPTEAEMRETYFKAYGKQFDSEDRKQHPLPIKMAYEVALRQLAGGSKLKKGEAVINAVGTKLIVHDVRDGEYWLRSFSDFAAQPWGIEKVDGYLATGEWTKDETHLAAGGTASPVGHISYTFKVPTAQIKTSKQQVIDNLTGTVGGNQGDLKNNVVEFKGYESLEWADDDYYSVFTGSGILDTGVSRHPSPQQKSSILHEILSDVLQNNHGVRAVDVTYTTGGGKEWKTHDMYAEGGPFTYTGEPGDKVIIELGSKPFKLPARFYIVNAETYAKVNTPFATMREAKAYADEHKLIVLDSILDRDKKAEGGQAEAGWKKLFAHPERFMKYEGQFLYPPRVEHKIQPASLDKLDNGQYLGELKYNGSSTSVTTSENKVVIKERHGTPFAIPPKFDFQSMHRGTGYMCFAGEFMNKSKKGPDGKPFRGFIIWDMMAFEGEILIGSTVEERKVLIDYLYPTTGAITAGSYDIAHKTATPDVYKVVGFESGFRAVFNELTKIEFIEGFVLKRKNAQLSSMNKVANNTESSVKCRKSTSNYKFEKGGQPDEKKSKPPMPVIKNAEVNISGIKCDECDYRDDTVRFEDYPKWINKPCPKCKANLLTQKDYDECVQIVNATDVVNSMSPDALDTFLSGFSEKQMDAALDFMNERVKKTGEDTFTIE